MREVPYVYWVEYIRDILEKIDYHPTTILDVACGTGTVAELLNERGYDVTGVDLSAPMVEVARRKAETNGLDIDYYVQDVAELNIPGKYDLAISLFDSLNYVIDPSRVETAFQHVYDQLVEGGVFIFDVNTEYALAHGFFNQSNVGSRRYPKYVWHSTYDREARICTVDMTFTVIENGQEIEFKETHLQRAHKQEELESWLVKAGFRILNVYDAYRFRAPGRRTDRAYFVARKVCSV
jgi:2-polyprenyl-3-methyl-5-hydroxy-6-metoxy-1,4-benzoquinol methylase